MDVVQHLRLLDVRRAQRRRLRVRGQPLRAGHRGLAGAGGARGGHRGRQHPVQSGREALPDGGRPLPGDDPGLLRRQGSQHPGDHPRRDRGRLVRHPDLSRLSRFRAPGAEVLARTRTLGRCRTAWFPRPVRARLGGFHPDVDPAGVRVLERHGNHPEVHRLLRSRSVCRHDRAGGLPGRRGRLGQRESRPVGRRRALRLVVVHDDDQRDRTRDLLFLRSDAQLR